MNLLSTPSLVESPFIIVKIGKYTFGHCDKKYINEMSTKVTFPNFMKSISIVKVNGAVNTYIIQMEYGITQNDDPNMLDKVFGSVANTRKITISYGDWSSPSFIYREEEAIITKVTSGVDFSSSRITYNISCTSSSLALRAGSYNFPAYSSKKPSEVIWSLLKNRSYGLYDIFYGMRKESDVKKLGLIAGDDRPVKIEAKQKINVVDYLNYLVNCMTSLSDTGNTEMKNSAYHLTIVDTKTGELPGPYFKITKVLVGTPLLNSLDTFEVDIGYPGANLVTSFQINNNETWSILYDYSKEINQSSYTYRINDSGELETVYSPNITTSRPLQYTTEADKDWWTKMTQFPITATMTLKGLIRPAILMSYVKINVLFYGNKHISSGLYIITRQQDIIDGSGYRTTLSLTRVGADTITASVGTPL